MKVFGYIRVSSAGQADKDGPVRQAAAISELVKDNSLELVRVFEDSITGTIEGINRPGFTDMLINAPVWGVEGIVIERLDRLARDLFVSEAIIRELRTRNLKLFSAERGMVDIISDDSDPGRKALRQILGVFAQYDRDSLVMKMRAARERKKKETGRCEGGIPFGEKGPGEAKALKLIINLVEQGFTYSHIAKTLAFGDVRRRDGSVCWQKMDIYHIMRRHKKQQKQQHKGAFHECNQSSQEAQEA